MSIAAGSKALGEAVEFERGPSIQNASVLQMKNGVADLRQRLLDPAALVEQLPRSSEMTIFGARRDARCASI